MSPRVSFAGAEFAVLHRALLGEPVAITDLALERFSPQLREEAQQTWHQRLVSEFRSVQIMTRFLTELVNAGDPLDVYAGAIDLVKDEVRHTELCFAVCRALGAPVDLPTPVALRDPEEFVRASFGERALHTAISMLIVNETLSTAFISDLRERCHEPAIRAVLDATLADEDEHHAFGWAYVAASLRRFPASTLPSWRALVQRVLAPHHQFVEETLRDLPAAQRALDAHPDSERIALGLFSRARQALVLERALDALLPRLRAHGLA
jgi:hypothetical protein